MEKSGTVSLSLSDEEGATPVPWDTTSSARTVSLNGSTTEEEQTAIETENGDHNEATISMEETKSIGSRSSSRRKRSTMSPTDDAKTNKRAHKSQKTTAKSEATIQVGNENQEEEAETEVEEDDDDHDDVNEVVEGIESGAKGAKVASFDTIDRKRSSASKSSSGGGGDSVQAPPETKDPPAKKFVLKKGVTYVTMIHDAIVELKDRSGSSIPAISKWLLANYEHLATVSPAVFRQNLNNGIKTGTKAGRFVKVKASYKINSGWVKKEKQAQRAKENERKARERKRKKETDKVRDDKRKSEEGEKEHKQREQEKKDAEEAKRESTMSVEEREAAEKKKADKEEAARRKAEAEARAREIAERIKKRRFPMDDLQLRAEDKELGVKPPADLQKRPTIPYVMNCLIPFEKRPTGGKTPSSILTSSSNYGFIGNTRGLFSDVLQVYHFFRGDVGYTKHWDTTIVAPFTLNNLLHSLGEVMNGSSKAGRVVPPLICHLFVGALKILTSSEDVLGGYEPWRQRFREDVKKLGQSLSATSWPDVCLYYMDRMERFYATDASLEATAGIATEFPVVPLVDEVEEKEGEETPNAMPSGYYAYLGDHRGSLAKAYTKLARHDPWHLSAEDLMTLLRALTDDITSLSAWVEMEMPKRMEELNELQKAKRTAEGNYRKMRLLYEGPKKPPAKKTGDESKAGGEDDNDPPGEKQQNQEEKAKVTGASKAPHVPKVSKKVYETAIKARTKTIEAYENGLLRLVSRTEPLGCDKNYNGVYCVFSDPERIFLEVIKPNYNTNVNTYDELVHRSNRSWHVIDKRSLFDAFLASLDRRGTRENALCDALTGGIVHAGRGLYDDVKKKSEEISRKKEMEELERRLSNAKVASENGRRSGRLASLAQMELVKVEEEMAVASAALEQQTAERDVNDGTDLAGLGALSDFESIKKKGSKGPPPFDIEILKCAGLVHRSEDPLTGPFGLVVALLLGLEDRCEQLVPWQREDLPRPAWRSNLRDVAGTWSRAFMPRVSVSDGDEGTMSGNHKVDDEEGESRNRRTSNGAGVTGGTKSSGGAATVQQLIQSLKGPLLELEARVYEISGVKSRMDANRMATEHESDGEEEEEPQRSDEETDEAKMMRAQQAWKKKIDKLRRCKAKRAATIRDALISAIRIARKADLTEVREKLQAALQLHRPNGGGAAKTKALELLASVGGYKKMEGEGDEGEEEFDEEDEQPENDASLVVESADSLLCDDAIVLTGSLGGDTDASRLDWIKAVKQCKTLSRFSSLAVAFGNRCNKLLGAMEEGKDTLEKAIESWKETELLANMGTTKRGGRSRPVRRRTKIYTSSSEVWTLATLSNEFVMGKADGYPWWPARKCVIADDELALSLASVNRVLVAFVGEENFCAAHWETEVRPYPSPKDAGEDLGEYSAEVLKSHRESLMIARRLYRALGPPVDAVAAVDFVSQESKSQEEQEREVQGEAKTPAVEAMETEGEEKETEGDDAKETEGETKGEARETTGEEKETEGEKKSIDAEETAGEAMVMEGKENKIEAAVGEVIETGAGVKA